MSRLKLFWRAFWLFWHASRADAARIDANIHNIRSGHALERGRHHERRKRYHEARR